MANKVEFKDFSFEVKAAINDETMKWLRETAFAIASHAKENCTMTDEAGVQLRKSYRAEVDENKGEAYIGSSLESSLWEEYGTGEHADTGKNGGKKGRQGWWIYTPGSDGPEGYQSRQYASQAEAEDMAKYIRKKYKKRAVVTNGRDPNYTLEKAFIAKGIPAKGKLEADMKARMG